jgi:hypothetical protein
VARVISSSARPAAVTMSANVAAIDSGRVRLRTWPALAWITTGRQPVGHGVMEFSREVNPLVADRLVRIPRSFCLKQLSRLSQLRGQSAA